jgi:hypothetical protein
MVQLWATASDFGLQYDPIMMKVDLSVPSILDLSIVKDPLVTMITLPSRAIFDNTNVYVLGVSMLFD